MLNQFPAKGGVSPYFSPQAIVTGDILDYDKHLSIPFGQYVQANNEPNPTNTEAPHARLMPSISAPHRTDRVDMK
jgi:hypothetical protein